MINLKKKFFSDHSASSDIVNNQWFPGKCNILAVDVINSSFKMAASYTSITEKSLDEVCESFSTEVPISGNQLHQLPITPRSTPTHAIDPIQDFSPILFHQNSESFEESTNTEWIPTCWSTPKIFTIQKKNIQESNTTSKKSKIIFLKINLKVT